MGDRRLTQDAARMVIARPNYAYLPALKSMTNELKLAERVIFTGGLYDEQKLAEKARNW